MKKVKSLLAVTMAVGVLMMQGTIGNTQTKTNHMSDESIRPFKVHIPEAQLADLKRRILATKWPEQETRQR